jgi:hypothetical protein
MYSFYIVRTSKTQRLIRRVRGADRAWEHHDELLIGELQLTDRARKPVRYTGQVPG